MNIRPLSILLALALIVSLSVNVLASNEQPSGSNYRYYDSTSIWGSDNFWSATSKSLYYIGADLRWMRQNWPSSSSSSSVWTATQASSITSNVSSIKTLSDSIEDRLTEISTKTLLIQGNTSSIQSSQTMIEGYTNTIRENITPIRSDLDSIELDTDSLVTNTDSLVTNTDTLLSVLGTPSEGSTFWSNQSQLNTRLNTFLTRFGTFSDHNFYYYTGRLHSRMAPLESDYTWFNGNQISTNTTNWFGSVASSLKGVGVRLVHIDDDFHSLHEKLGNPIDSGSTIFSLLTDLHTVFASSEDLEMHNNNSDNYAQANDDFFTGQDSSSSIGTGTLSSLKGVADNVGSFFQVDSSIAPISIFGILDQGNDGTDGPWKWFSRTTLNDLDHVQSTRKSVPEGQEIVDFFTPHEEEFQNMLGADKR